MIGRVSKEWSLTKIKLLLLELVKVIVTDDDRVFFIAATLRLWACTIRQIAGLVLILRIASFRHVEESKESLTMTNRLAFKIADQNSMWRATSIVSSLPSNCPTDYGCYWYVYPERCDCRFDWFWLWIRKFSLMFSRGDCQKAGNQESERQGLAGGGEDNGLHTRLTWNFIWRLCFFVNFNLNKMSSNSPFFLVSIIYYSFLLVFVAINSSFCFRKVLPVIYPVQRTSAHALPYIIQPRCLIDSKTRWLHSNVSVLDVLDLYFVLFIFYT